MNYKLVAKNPNVEALQINEDIWPEFLEAINAGEYLPMIDKNNRDLMGNDGYEE